MPRRSYQAIADDFEKKMLSLLKRSGFVDVKGGKSFFLGKNQIDACGGSDETLFIIECKTSGRIGARLWKEIRYFRGQIDSIRAAARRHETYRRYKNYVFIIATDFDINKRDVDAAGRKIHLWNRAFTSYYDQLASKLGAYTKFSIFGELRLKPRQVEEECLPCIKSRVRNVNLFLFIADPRMILRWAYVARREVGSEHYYQRFVESGKLQGIAKYIREEGGYFANAAVLAFNKKPQFKVVRGPAKRFPEWAQGKMEFGLLYFPASYRSCLIIDGQHRLYGSTRVNKPTIMMPMVALERATIEHQGQLFLDINKNQKQVPSDLVWDLEGEMRPDSFNGVISRVAKALNRKGVFRGKIYIPQDGRKRRGQLKLSGICTAVSNQKLTDRVLKSKVENPLYAKDPDRQIKIVVKSINLALSSVERVFEQGQKARFWYQNSGVAIMLALIGRVVAHCEHAPSKREYRKYFKALKSHFSQYRSHERVKALRQRCNSEGGREEVVSEFVRAISKELDDDSFGEGLPEDKFEKRIKHAERKLADLMAKVLSVGDNDWFVYKVAGAIKDRAVDRSKKQNADGEPLHNFLTFGEVIEIIKQTSNWTAMQPYLVFKGGFDNQSQFETAGNTVNGLRGRTMHGRGKFTDADESLLDGYLQKFEAAITRG